MPRKSKEEYNEYMRNYMRKKYKQDTGKPPMDGDFDATKAPTLDLNSGTGKELMQIGKEVFKDPETGKPDKILTYIEQGAKYLPLIMKFAEGFMSNMKAFNAQQQPQIQQTQEQKISPPEGWEHFSPLEKMKYKYSRPQWYEAGLAWDAYKETGQINSQVNTGYVDPAYTQPRRGQPIQHDQQVNSLQDLSRKHPEPPLVKDDDTPTEAQPVHDPKLEAVIKEKQARHMGKKTEDNKMQEEQSKEQPQEEPMQEAEIVEALRQDNARYIQLAIQFLGSMEMKEFQSKINSLDEVVKRIEPMLDLLPIHLREMIKKTPDNEILQIFEQNCKDKFDWCKKNKKLPKISEMFNLLKSKL